MKTYSILQRPDTAGSDPDYEVVRNGFNWWAFLFPPFWLLLSRQWLGFAAFVAASTMLGLATALLSLTPGLDVVLTFLLSFIVGAEAQNWRRWRLEAPRRVKRSTG